MNMKTKKRGSRERKIGVWDCKRHYSLSWSYIKECKNQIYFILALILGSALVGLIYQPPEIYDLIQKFLQDLLSQTQELNWWQMIIFILNNNLQTSFFSMIFGVFFGIFPVLAGFSNGYVLGFVAEKAVAIGGLLTLWRLLPHGIFEFPAIILSLALGMRFGMFWFAGKGKKKKEFFRRLDSSMRVFLFVVLPLLIIAAIIEGILIVILS